jgi:hypothetical protein
MGFELVSEFGGSTGLKPGPDNTVALWMRFWELDEHDTKVRMWVIVIILCSIARYHLPTESTKSFGGFKC